MGFSLRIVNAPSNAVLWHADFAENTFTMSPIGDSGYNSMSWMWNYPGDPGGVSTLAIIIINSANQVIHQVYNRGPVNDGGEYSYDVATKQLVGAAAPPPSGIHIEFIDTVFSIVWDVSEFLLFMYHLVGDWIWPFYLLQTPLLSLYYLTRDALTPIAHFGEWADDVATRTSQLLSLDQIRTNLRYWLDLAESSWSWIRNAAGYIWNIIEDHWNDTRSSILAWIAEVRSFATSLVDEVRVTIAEVEDNIESFTARIPTYEEVVSWWRGWTGYVLGVIDTWWTGAMGDVVNLINTAFLDREDFWTGWRDIRDEVYQFFNDPIEYAWNKFIDWFLGPEG